VKFVSLSMRTKKATETRLFVRKAACCSQSGMLFAKQRGRGCFARRSRKPLLFDISARRGFKTKSRFRYGGRCVRSEKKETRAADELPFPSFRSRRHGVVVGSTHANRKRSKRSVVFLQIALALFSWSLLLYGPMRACRRSDDAAAVSTATPCGRRSIDRVTIDRCRMRDVLFESRPLGETRRLSRSQFRFLLKCRGDGHRRSRRSLHRSLHRGDRSTWAAPNCLCGWGLSA